MEKEKTIILLNMSDYTNKVEDMSYDMLKAEFEKVQKRLKLTYTILGNGYYIDKEINIADKPDEMNRIYVRKKVAAISKIISGQLKEFSSDNFDIYWKTINDAFMKSTSYPSYADADIGKKNIPFANRLNVKGLTAYKRFLLCLSDNIPHNRNLLVAINHALNEEMYYDEGKLDRTDFYTNEFLPQSIDTVVKNISKLRILRSQMKKIGNYEKITEEENKIS